MIKKIQSGVTLIELLVVITILAGMTLLVFSLFNSQGPLSRATDSQRQQDLRSIKTALESFYSDNNCYPEEIPFGDQWRVGDTVYMAEVPQDPTCSNDVSSCYVYIWDDTTSCPQWYSVFSQLSSPSLDDDDTVSIAEVEENCSLYKLNSCVPSDFTSEWSCISSGEVDCSFVSNIELSAGSSGVSCLQEEKNRSCSGTPARCNAVPAGTGTYCSDNCGGAC